MAKKNVISVAKARNILGVTSKNMADDEVLRILLTLESISEIIISETYGSKYKSVLDFIDLMYDNRHQS